MRIDALPLARWWACRWAARRVQAALDDDPDGQLSLRDLHRLADHLSVCRRCSTMATQYRRLTESLASLVVRELPDAVALHRLRQIAAALRSQESA